MQASDDRAREQLKRESAKAEFFRVGGRKERTQVARERKIRKYSKEKRKRQREKAPGRK